jgi:ferritin
MKLSAKMQDALNKQINAEIYSAYLYLAMAAQFRCDNWKGIAHWMEVQAKEEWGHAMKIYKYIDERLGKISLEAIAKPPAKWASPLAAFEAALAHEQKVTAMFDALVALAEKEKDNATLNRLQWFVDEQVEEEGQTDDIVQKLKLVGGQVQGMFILDSLLGKRED